MMFANQTPDTNILYTIEELSPPSKKATNRPTPTQNGPNSNKSNTKYSNKVHNLVNHITNDEFMSSRNDSTERCLSASGGGGSVSCCDRYGEGSMMAMNRSADRWNHRRGDSMRSSKSLANFRAIRTASKLRTSMDGSCIPVAGIKLNTSNSSVLLEKQQAKKICDMEDQWEQMKSRLVRSTSAERGLSTSMRKDDSVSKFALSENFRMLYQNTSVEPEPARFEKKPTKRSFQAKTQGSGPKNRSLRAFISKKTTRRENRSQTQAKVAQDTSSSSSTGSIHNTSVSTIIKKSASKPMITTVEPLQLKNKEKIISLEVATERDPLAKTDRSPTPSNNNNNPSKKKSPTLRKPDKNPQVLLQHENTTPTTTENRPKRHSKLSTTLNDHKENISKKANETSSINKRNSLKPRYNVIGNSCVTTKRHQNLSRVISNLSKPASDLSAKCNTTTNRTFSSSNYGSSGGWPGRSSTGSTPRGAVTTKNSNSRRSSHALPERNLHSNKASIDNALNRSHMSKPDAGGLNNSSSNGSGKTTKALQISISTTDDVKVKVGQKKSAVSPCGNKMRRASSTRNVTSSHYNRMKSPMVSSTKNSTATAMRSKFNSHTQLSRKDSGKSLRLDRTKRSQGDHNQTFNKSTDVGQNSTWRRVSIGSHRGQDFRGSVPSSTKSTKADSLNMGSKKSSLSFANANRRNSKLDPSDQGNTEIGEEDCARAAAKSDIRLKLAAEGDLTPKRKGSDTAARVFDAWEEIPNECDRPIPLSTKAARDSSKGQNFECEENADPNLENLSPPTGKAEKKLDTLQMTSGTFKNLEFTENIRMEIKCHENRPLTLKKDVDKRYLAWNRPGGYTPSAVVKKVTSPGSQDYGYMRSGVSGQEETDAAKTGSGRLHSKEIQDDWPLEATWGKTLLHSNEKQKTSPCEKIRAQQSPYKRVAEFSYDLSPLSSSAMYDHNRHQSVDDAFNKLYREINYKKKMSSKDFFRIKMELDDEISVIKKEKNLRERKQSWDKV